MCYDTKAVYDITKKTGINPKRVIYFPFEQYAFFGKRLPYIGDKQIDLLYGANSFRKKREKKMVKYFLDLPEDIDVQFYGKMKEKDFNPKLVENKRWPLFTPPVQYKENLTRLNEAIATVNISDNFNEGRQLNPRVYETVLANVVSFMDIDYDPKKLAFRDPFLQEFLYINSQEELINKLRQLKADPKLMVQVIDAQYDTTFVTVKELSDMFAETMAGLMGRSISELDNEMSKTNLVTGSITNKALF